MQTWRILNDLPGLPYAMNEANWLDWAQRLAAIAQNGLTYAENHYDRERYEQIRAIAAEIMAGHSDGEVPAILDLFGREEGYATPKVDVRGAVFEGDRILLVREASDGLWTLPGGWADVGDTPSQAIEREIWEESGYRARAVRLVALYDRNTQGHPPMPFYAYKAFFLCELLGGSAAVSDETTAVGFFARDEIPPLSTGRLLPHQVERMFAHHDDPDLPTEYD